jgi:hypothetical protein
MAENSEETAKRGPGRPFQPGQSGNPGGRPKGLREWRELCRDASPDALQVVVDLLAKGDLTAARFIIEQAWGRAPQSVEFYNRSAMRAGVERIRKALEPFPDAHEAVGRALDEAKAEQDKAELEREQAWGARDKE